MGGNPQRTSWTRKSPGIYRWPARVVSRSAVSQGECPSSWTLAEKGCSTVAVPTLFLSHRMQRRPGRGFAHISPPISPHIPREKVSRLNQRNLGVTNRIWALLSLFLFLIIFTRYALPSTQKTHELQPKVYTNSTVTNPFKFCPVHGPDDKLAAKYGAQTLSKSMLHVASGERVQRVLNKALAGNPVTISILGGSGIFFTTSYPNFLSPSPSICLPRSRRRSRFSSLLPFSFL